EVQRASGEHRLPLERRGVCAREGHRAAVRADLDALLLPELSGRVHEPVAVDDRVALARPLRPDVLGDRGDGHRDHPDLLGRGGSGGSVECREREDGSGEEPTAHSHSIVAGGFEVTSRTTRLTAGISFTIRDETSSTRSYGSRAQSAVIASSDVTARITIG